MKNLFKVSIAIFAVVVTAVIALRVGYDKGFNDAENKLCIIKTVQP